MIKNFPVNYGLYHYPDSDFANCFYIIIADYL